MSDERNEYEAAWDTDETLTADPETEVVEETVAEEPEATTPAQEEIDYKALYDKEVQRLRSTEGRYRAELQRLQQAQNQGYAAPQEQDPDDAFLAKFRQDYSDDVVKAIDLVATRRAQALLSQSLNQYVAPLHNTQQELAATAHFSAIEAAHPDAFEIAEDPTFNAWIDSRPDHLRDAYVRVRDSGTPREVISMLNEFKETRHPKSNQATSKQVAAASAVKRNRGGLPSTGGLPPEDEFAAAWAAAPD